MKYTKERLDTIYERTDGYCHLCHKKLARTNYARCGARAAWEVDHSVARRRGGSDHGNNLVAACIPCNRSKGARDNRAVRIRNGASGRPKSKAQRQEAEATAAILTGAAVVGSLLWLARRNRNGSPQW